jgi:hypothetical protein
MDYLLGCFRNQSMCKYLEKQPEALPSVGNGKL